jgi:Peptidase family M1 domain
MKPAMRILLLAAVVLIAFVRAVSAQPAGQGDPIELLVLQLEQAGASGDSDKVLALAHPDAQDAGLEEYAYWVNPAPTRVVLKERDRSVLPDGTTRLLLEMFVERGTEARLSTWEADVREAAGGAPGDANTTPRWRVMRMARLAVVSGLYRLSLDATRQFDVRDLTLVAPDFKLHMAEGTAFVAEIPEGTTAVVLLGRGRMTLAPQDSAEQTQVRIFGGSDSLDADFDGAFIRVRPSEFFARFRAESLTARTVSTSDLRRASDIFDEFIGRTLQIDMNDLSRQRWSLVPSAGDLIAEVRTRRHGHLTYARTWNDSEDVSFFDRRKRRNIAVYASTEKLAARGRFYSEDDLVDYDILSYNVDAAFAPERQWVSGNSRLTLKVRSAQLTTMSLRLAESLVVRGVYSPEFGRLLHLRVVGQHTLIVNLPASVPRDTEITLNVLYAGRVEPQELEREAITVTQDQELIQIPLEPRFIYSNRSYWYPQGTFTDYATAKVRITVPNEFDVVATGMPAAETAPAPGPVEPGARPRKVFLFETERPVRYIGCVISRFSTVTTAVLNIPAADVHGAADTDDGAGPDGNAVADPERATNSAVSLIVQANPRQAARARSLSQKSAEIIRFYASLVGEAPYPSMTLAVTESDLPGGHSPPYFVILNQPLPTSPVSWRNDPVAFENYPTFFLAHELAHQWWGQAVGWKNYHEQWISEGFAQYFAALFAERERGTAVMQDLFRQMRRTGMSASDQGPIYLGYRLGHIRQDSRVFRALVYNKAAMVLHMLRRHVGDEAFFTGVREFYSAWRFKKAGANDFRIAMEAASKRDLGPFFEGWIYGASIPTLKFSYKQTGEEVTLRFEHRRDVMPVPVTVRLTYSTGETQQVVVPVTERVVERNVPLSGTLRKVEVNEDGAALAEVER